LTQPPPDRHPAPRRCQLCGSTAQLRPAAIVRPSVVEAIRAEHPDWSEAGFICHSDLARYRGLHVERILAGERGELTQLEHQVIESLAKHEILAENVDAEFEGELTLGERLADRIAEFGGSWTFILCFWAVLVTWILFNTALVAFGRFDPYPFILLNLVLSCLAALQAPVIMMSQNRLEAKDRLRSEHDYRVNLKAELEIRHLHEKLDHLLSHQWERLIEVQQVQLELLEELAEARGRVARRRAEAAAAPARPPEAGERD
jgi:uncharacterized membrane protein